MLLDVKPVYNPDSARNRINTSCEIITDFTDVAETELIKTMYGFREL
jgi:hypothetical protein